MQRAPLHAFLFYDRGRDLWTPGDAARAAKKSGRRRSGNAGQTQRPALYLKTWAACFWPPASAHMSVAQLYFRLQHERLCLEDSNIAFCR